MPGTQFSERQQPRQPAPGGAVGRVAQQIRRAVAEDQPRTGKQANAEMVPARSFRVTYAELQAASAFSFLRGASRAEELAATAAALGLSAIGIADRNTVAGVVRAHDAARQAGIRLLPGARLVFRDGTPDVLCYPTDRAAWGRLTRLLTKGKSRAPHGDTSELARATNRCFLDYADLLEHGEGQALLAVPPHRLDAAFRKAIGRLAQDFPSAASASSHAATSAR